ncbi:MAG: tRNA dihydrouridine(20/20a) synthase DusA [Micavibrio sp.]|nr:tRNA dihydrouridine(20/20a) synthase DusA [Micavibrio sp.]
MAKMTNYPYKFSVAPMMDWTDRHCRYFHRLLSPNAYLYTEMITAKAIIHGDKDRLLGFNAFEKPLALQLGGSDPQELAKAAKIGESYGYDEINLNCGCPSDRVQSGMFGACLMAEPVLVANCVKAMQDAVSVPVTVKCRIGIDDSEDFAFLDRFVKTIADIGCGTFIIHARKAWLQGLSPKQNREVPPLDYDIVKQIKDKYSDLVIGVNGGIKTLEDVKSHLKNFDSVMIGREVYQNPLFLVALEQAIFNKDWAINEHDMLTQMGHYAEQQHKDYGTPLKSISRHMTGLFAGQHGARYWRQQLAERAHKDDVPFTLFTDIYNEIQQ